MYISRDKGNGRPTVVRFNPWWFAGRDDLIRSFFDQLLGKLIKGHAIAKKTASAIKGLGPLVQSLVSLTEKSPDHVSASASTLMTASSTWKKFPR